MKAQLVRPAVAHEEGHEADSEEEAPGAIAAEAVAW